MPLKPSGPKYGGMKTMSKMPLKKKSGGSSGAARRIPAMRVTKKK